MRKSCHPYHWPCAQKPLQNLPNKHGNGNALFPAVLIQHPSSQWFSKTSLIAFFSGNVCLVDEWIYDLSVKDQTLEFITKLDTHAVKDHTT